MSNSYKKSEYALNRKTDEIIYNNSTGVNIKIQLYNKDNTNCDDFLKTVDEFFENAKNKDNKKLEHEKLLCLLEDYINTIKRKIDSNEIITSYDWKIMTLLMSKIEWFNDNKQTRNRVDIESKNHNSKIFHQSAEDEFFQKEDKNEMLLHKKNKLTHGQKMLTCLTPTQRRRWVAHRIKNKSIRQIANDENVRPNAVRESIVQADECFERYKKEHCI